MSDLQPFEAARYIKTPIDVFEYMKAVMASGEPDYLMNALADVFASPAWKDNTDE